jgi:hypothetical protein
MDGAGMSQRGVILVIGGETTTASVSRAQRSAADAFAIEHRS